MGAFKAIVVDKSEGGQSVAVRDLDEADLMEGDVTVQVTHSTLNYKDGLALTGKAPVIRRFPMIPGIDFAGLVETSVPPGLQAGRPGGPQRLGHRARRISGGYAEKARVKGDWLIPLPNGLNPAQAMAIGTAGYTAMLALLALERHGLTPEHGPAVVTGAAGGVGSVAIAILRRNGWRVIASTGRPEEADYLTGLGAAEVIDRHELSQPGKPLGKERWAAGIDSVGSTTLANLLAGTRYGGAIAACGLAGGMDLPSSVAPFILRGVSPARHRQCHGPEGAASRGLGPPRPRPRPRQAPDHDAHDPLRRRDRGRATNPRGSDPGPRGRRDPVTTAGAARVPCRGANRARGPLAMSTYRLEKLLAPASVAVADASPREGSLGRTLPTNLRRARHVPQARLLRTQRLSDADGMEVKLSVAPEPAQLSA